MKSTKYERNTPTKIGTIVPKNVGVVTKNVGVVPKFAHEQVRQ